MISKLELITYFVKSSILLLYLWINIFTIKISVVVEFHYDWPLSTSLKFPVIVFGVVTNMDLCFTVLEHVLFFLPLGNVSLTKYKNSNFFPPNTKPPPTTSAYTIKIIGIVMMRLRAHNNEWVGNQT